MINLSKYKLGALKAIKYGVLILFIVSIILLPLEKVLAYEYISSKKNLIKYNNPLPVIMINNKQATTDESTFIDLRGIVVDSEGNIYLGNHFFTKVQVYDNKGGFLYSLHIDSDGGDFAMKIDDNDNLIVATVRNDMVYTFSKGGYLVNTEKNNDEAYEGFGTSDSTEFIDKQGNKFEISNLLLYSHIVKISSDGSKKTLISISFLAWLFKILIFIIFGSIPIVVILSKHQEKA